MTNKNQVPSISSLSDVDPNSSDYRLFFLTTHFKPEFLFVSDKGQIAFKEPYRVVRRLVLFSKFETCRDCKSRLNKAKYLTVKKPTGAKC